MRSNVGSDERSPSPRYTRCRGHRPARRRCTPHRRTTEQIADAFIGEVLRAGSVNGTLTFTLRKLSVDAELLLNGDSSRGVAIYRRAEESL